MSPWTPMSWKEALLARFGAGRFKLRPWCREAASRLGYRSWRALYQSVMRAAEGGRLAPFRLRLQDGWILGDGDASPKLPPAPKEGRLIRLSDEYALGVAARLKAGAIPDASECFTISSMLEELVGRRRADINGRRAVPPRRLLEWMGGDL